MLVVLIATGAIVKDYVLGSVLFAVVVLLSFAIGRGRMAASFSFAYLFLMGIFWVTTMLPPNAAGALGSFALACPSACSRRSSRLPPRSATSRPPSTG